jgi:phosphoketolase
MKIIHLAAIAAMGAALSGCASIVEGTTQSLAVTTSPIEGAKCVLTSSEGTYFVTTPGNAIVHKTKNDLNVVCKHDGFADGTKAVTPHFVGTTAGNIIAGGLVGIAVDAATGADFAYPEEIHIDMQSLKPVVPAAEATPPTTVAPDKIAKPSTSS